jgi:hypothetical protein
VYLTVSRALNRSTSPLRVDATGVSHRLTGTQPKYLSSRRGRDRCISQSHGHSTEVPLLSAWTRRVYLTVSRALNRSTSPPSVDATGVSHRLTGTQPKYLSSQHGCDRTANRCISQSHGHLTEVPLLSAWTRPVYLTVSRALNRSTSPLSVDATGVSHSLTGTQPKYLSSQHGCYRTANRCISQSHGHSTEVPLLSAWTRPVYLTVSRALNRSTSPLRVDATGVSHRLTGTQPKYLSSQHGCDRTANRCISQSHGHTTEVTLHSVWTRPVYPWALRFVH